MKKFFTTLVILSLLISFGNQNAFAEEIIRYVTVAGAGNNNGTSWGNAYPGTQLQTAINASGVTQVWVAKGTYKPTTGSDRNSTFSLKNDCTIYGGFAGSESDVSERTNFRYGETNETILSGNIGDTGSNADNTYHVVSGNSSLNSSAILDGFTIREGYANYSSNYCQYGGGLFLYENNDPTIKNCVFVYNDASDGGGGAGTWYNCDATFINCKFMNNSAVNWGGGASVNGNNSFVNCVFTGNTCANGGGICLNNGSPNLINCTFSNNTATDGGGIYNGGSSSLTLKNCIVWGNDASSNGDEIYIGGTLYLNYSCYANESGDIYGSPNTGHCITQDPQFVGSSNNPSHPYSIGGISPCADAGNDSYCDESYDVRGSGFGRKLNKTTGASGTIDMGAYEYKVGTDASLPVELTDFSAQAVSGGVLLTWTTESETENLGFIIERKIVGAIHESPSSWLQIASYVTDKELTGHGSTSEKHKYQYTDKAVQPGLTYLYRLADVDYSGKVTWHMEVEVKVEAESVQIPEKFGLQPVYPNPFNPSLTIPYGLTENGQMTLKVYNLRGQLVETLVNTNALKGTYSYTWQPLNLSAGIYFIQLQSGNRVNLQKVVFVK